MKLFQAARLSFICLGVASSACNNDLERQVAEVENALGQCRSELSASNQALQTQINAARTVPIIDHKQHEPASGGSTSPHPIAGGQQNSATIVRKPTTVADKLALLQEIRLVDSVRFGDLMLRIKDVQIADRWTADRHSLGSQSVLAEKGSKFLIIQYSVTWPNKEEPVHPTFDVYAMDQYGELLPVCRATPRHDSWSSHEALLGLEIDTVNNFRLQDTVRFSAACQLSETDLRSPVIVAARVSPCHYRTFGHLGDPAIRFEHSCPSAAKVSIYHLAEGSQFVHPIKVLSPKAKKR